MQLKVSAIKDREGRVLADKKEIRRWMEYCGELYAEQVEQESTKRELEELQRITPPSAATFSSKKLNNICRQAIKE